jgi:hypothetical protein
MLDKQRVANMSLRLELIIVLLISFEIIITGQILLH